MKVQNIERQDSRKMATNKFLEKKEQMVIKKKIPLSKHKCHENKKDTKIENNLYTLLKQSNQDTLTEISCVKNQRRLQSTKNKTSTPYSWRDFKTRCPLSNRELLLDK